MQTHKVATALVLSLLLAPAVSGQVQSQPSNQSGARGISMILYPVERGSDGLQYLITPAGHRVHIPGLGIAPDAAQVSVYRDQSSHFWYTDLHGQPTAVTPQQLEFASAQINAQSGAPPVMPSQRSVPGTNIMPAQSGTPGQMPGSAGPSSAPCNSYYSSNQSYSGGFNGIPYGAPINMEGTGQYSYAGPNGDRQYVSPAVQSSAQFNEWQQQKPWTQQPPAPTSQNAYQQQNHSSGVFPGVRDNRASRLGTRSQSQADRAASSRDTANYRMQSGNPIAAGVNARHAGRLERRSNRSERRAERWGN